MFHPLNKFADKKIIKHERVTIMNCITRSLPRVVRYDDWSYELGKVEFEGEKKYIPPYDNNNDGGDGGGCFFALFVAIAIICFLVYVFSP